MLRNDILFVVKDGRLYWATLPSLEISSRKSIDLSGSSTVSLLQNLFVVVTFLLSEDNNNSDEKVTIKVYSVLTGVLVNEFCGNIRKRRLQDADADADADEHEDEDGPEPNWCGEYLLTLTDEQLVPYQLL